MNLNFEEIQVRLLGQPNPELVIEGEIQPQTYNKVALALTHLRSIGAPPLQILFDSNGGSVKVGLDIYDLIRLYPNDTVGLVVNKAASMAAIILQACKKRTCAQHASILIHHVSRRNISLDEIANARSRERILANMRADQGKLYRILAERTGKPVSAIRKVCKQDRFMSAEVALDFGLIDQIV